MAKLEIVKDSEGNKIVLIQKFYFLINRTLNGNQWNNIWKSMWEKLWKQPKQREVVYIGKKFPDEYSGSLYTRKSKGARAKAKANAAQGIMEMIEIAAQKVFCENQKRKTFTGSLERLVLLSYKICITIV